jgi:hypothetical protein
MKAGREALAGFVVGAALMWLFTIPEVLAENLKPGAVTGSGRQGSVNTGQLQTKMNSLEQANASMSQQMTKLESDVNRLLSQKSVAQGKRAVDFNQLRADVLKVMAPHIEKLEALDAGYSRHTHEYMGPRGGWATLGSVENCPECLVRINVNPNSRPSKSPRTGTPE